MNCAAANEINMVEYLSTMGYAPVKVRGVDHWYCSPLRDEAVPSFKINKLKNCWYDHGEGRGGKLVDFVVAYFKCTTAEALQKIAGGAGSYAIQRNTVNLNAINSSAEADNTLDDSLYITSARQPITDMVLRNYAKQRNIPVAVLNQWCFEVEFSIHKKSYRAIGFKNKAGGFELRNHWFKGSSSPKFISYIDNASKNLAVFEGFF